MNRPVNSGHQHSGLSLIIVCVAMVIAPGFGSSAQALDLVPHAQVVTADTGPAGPIVVRVASYDPSAAYQGSHESQRVYKIELGLRMWKANRRPAAIREVTCREARLALEQKGVWTGRLAEDGACIPGDETQWATGNYLNFQERPQDTDADQ